ncbi:expressed unknown protein [Seminavis robusta]|uniref:Uncharacterized protein n=1 Tax=Seminavis robusta TaxID=568900 RepID=A0A9N8EHM0_9STRA|nr:expressed unknown protein [Seminavis robusta]|eukprot:Sro1181_g249830.1 n/a (90) ;mRNA; f:8602-8975
MQPHFENTVASHRGNAPWNFDDTTTRTELQPAIVSASVGRQHDDGMVATDGCGLESSCGVNTAENQADGNDDDDDDKARDYRHDGRWKE